MSTKSMLFNGAVSPSLTSFGLLVLRVGTGLLMAAGHGWSKLLNFRALSSGFPDPLGLGPFPTLLLALLAEVVCALLIVLGFATRLVVLPLIGTMAVAFTIVHADDPWARKELSALFLVPLLTLLFTGPGRYSLDARLGKK